MAENKLKTYAGKAKSAVKKVPKKIYVALCVIVAAAIVLVIILNNRPYTVLFTDLNSTDMSSILTYLESAGVTDYKVENNDTILVPGNQEPELKARLLREGYPQSSGFGYTYSENLGALSTESERQSAELRDLQDRMSAVVRCLEGVKDAVVTITPGEDTSYILDNNRVVKATASVMVTMNDGATLSTQQAAAIRSLVAHAVQGLEVSQVEISDTMGNTYTTGSSTADSDASALKMQLEEEYENKIRTKVMQALLPYYGEGNVRVSVSCVVDVSQRTVDSREVFLPEYAQDGSTGGKGIIGSQVYGYYYARPEGEVVGGEVGSNVNSDFSEYVEDQPELDGSETEVDVEGQVDYDNSFTETSALYTAGYLTDCSISVSVNSNVLDLQTIRVHAARAAVILGTIDEETGEENLDRYISVVAQPFYVEDEPPAIEPEPDFFHQEVIFGLPMWMILAAGGGLLLFIIILIAILNARRKKKKKRRLEEQEAAAFAAAARAYVPAPAPAPAEGADVMSMQTEKSMELRKDIRKFAEDNPEIAAQMVRGWLRGDSDDG